MHEDLDKRYVLRREFEELQDYSVRTRRMARNISQDLKDLANKIENDMEDDAFELDISKGRLRFGNFDLYKIIIGGSLFIVGVCLYTLIKASL